MEEDMRKMRIGELDVENREIWRQVTAWGHGTHIDGHRSK